MAVPATTSGEYYPGFAEVAALSFRYGPSSAVSPLAGDDLALGWYLDFHYPMGVAPLSHVLLGAVFEGSAAAADRLPAAASHGLAGRTVGPHVYSAAVEIADAGKRAERASRAARALSDYPRTFRQQWQAAAGELDRRFGQVMSGARSHADARLLDEAVELAGHGWRLHFEVMYRLLALDASFETLFQALGITAGESTQLRVSGTSPINDADRALAELAAAVQVDGLAGIFERHEPPALLEQLRASRRAEAWLAGFDAVVDTYGDRTDIVLDVDTPSWRENRLQPLAIVRRWALGAETMPPGTGRADGRARTVQKIRERLSPADRRTFAVGLAAADAANFAWWNEEHNAHIDLRLHLALRSVARAVVAHSGMDPDDAAFLFAEEVRGLAAGELRAPDVVDLPAARREWRARWLAQRSELPRRLGAGGTPVDPVMAHVIGGTAAVDPASSAVVLSGLAASAGVRRGRVRVIRTPDQLALLQPGEVLVCEATSPSWTPAFVTAVACVCDSGGVLTHAAIICREYGLPCVCAVGVATRVLRDGDLVEVDGTAGTVTRLDPA